MNRATLRAEGLSVGYRTRGAGISFVLSGIDAQVQPGRMVCILGPNGSGKSTLLRTLAGFQAPLSGRVLLGERSHEVYTVTERARFLAVVLTERIDAGMLTVRELVSLGRYPHTAWTGGLSPEDHRVVEWAVEAVGASELAPRPVMSLSDGERQKVMIARALAQEPKLILLDEPTAFLDLPRKIEVMSLLGALARNGGLSVVLSTHELELAQALADRLWLIRPGAAGAQKRASLVTGTPEDLVLSGDYERLFESAGVHFDREGGRFLFDRRTRRRAVLAGSGLGRRWTERALSRVGIEAVEPGEVDPADRELPTIRVDPQGEGYRWTVERDGGQRTCASIAELISLLDLEAPPDDEGLEIKP